MGDAANVWIERFPKLLDGLRDVSISTGEEEIREIRNRSLGWDALLDRWIAGLEIKEGEALAVSGVGDGSHLIRLLDTLPRHCSVFCGELDKSIAKAFLESDNASKLLADDRFFLGIGELDDSFFETMEKFPVLNVVGAQPIIFAPFYQRNEEGYARFFLEFVRHLEHWRKLFGTNVVSSGDWQRNTIANTRHLIGAPDLGEFQDAFAGATLTLVSAGPSLDESLEFLKSIKENSLIVAVNSSYRAVRNAGIVPHFVLAADPFEHTAKGFEGVSCDGSILICPFIVHPPVVETFFPRILTWSGENLLASYLRLKLGLPLGTNVIEKGTVSACAFDLARIFGCSEIVLVGQDLAISSSGQSHAKDSFYSDLNGNRANVDACRHYPGNTLESVLVEEKLMVYLKTFEELARLNKNRLSIWNTSRLGARIKGIPYVEFSEIQRRLRDGQEPSINEKFCRIFDSLSDDSTSWKMARSELDKFDQYVHSVCSLSLKLAILLESNELNESKNVKDTVAKAFEIRGLLIEQLESHQDFHSILKDGALKYELLQHSREMRSSLSTENPLNKEIEELLSFAWALAEGSFKLLSDLRASLK